MIFCATFCIILSTFLEQDFANLHSSRVETTKLEEGKDDEILENEVVEKGMHFFPYYQISLIVLSLKQG